MSRPSRRPAMPIVAATLAAAVLVAAGASLASPRGAAAAGATPSGVSVVAQRPDDPDRPPSPASPNDDDGVLSIASVSPWVAAEGEFQVRFDPSTRIPADAQLSVTIHQAIRPEDTLRGSVEDILDDEAPGRILRRLDTRPLIELGDPTAGTVLTIPIRPHRGDSERILLPNPGIHPVELVITAADGPELWSQIVFLNRLPEVDEDEAAPPPVRVTLLLPIGSGPAVGTDGGGTISLEEQSSLGSIGALLGDARDAPLTIAPRPNTLDGMTLTDEPWAGDLLATIADDTTAHELLALPYVAADTGGLVASGNGGELAHQIQLGRQTVERVAERPARTDTWAFDDTLTPQSLATLARAGIDSVLLPSTALDLPDGLDDDDVAARPVRLAGDSGIRALAFDGEISGRLAGTAFEPGTRAHEVVTLLMATWFDRSDADEHAEGPASVVLITAGTDPRVLEALLPSLTGGGPLRAEPAGDPVPDADHDVTEEVVELSPRRPSDQRSAVQAARDTRRITDAYSSMTGDADPDLWSWQRTVDQTLSSAIDDGQRLQMHLAVRGGVEERLAAIEQPPERSVVVTSRETTVPLRFRNDLDFDVALVLRARSQRLDIAGGDTRRIVLHPGENRVDLPVTVQAAGESLLRIELRSPVEGIELDGPDIPVRSTAISGVGAALSIISVLFLIGWWIHTHRRDGRNGAKLAGDHPSTPGDAGSLRPGG